MAESGGRLLCVLRSSPLESLSSQVKFSQSMQDHYGEKLLCCWMYEQVLDSSEIPSTAAEFPTDPTRGVSGFAAVNRKDWAPTEYSWIYGAHFISGHKSNDPVSPDYVPSVFSHVKSPKRRKLVKDMDRYERVAATRKIRLETNERMSAAQSLLELSEDENGSQFCEPHTGTSIAMSCVILKFWNVDTRICYR